MIRFTFGVVVGIMLATVGFNGIARLGNNTIHHIQEFSKTNIY